MRRQAAQHTTYRGIARVMALILIFLGGLTLPAEADDHPLPPGLKAREVNPLRGEDLEKALTPLEQVLASIEDPGFLNPDQHADARDPSRSAQRAYVAGREAFLDGRSFDAIPRLITATRLAPREPAFNELLAKVYAATGSSVAAQRYARQAIASEPDRRSALLLLLRLSADTNDHQQTLAVARRIEQLLDASDSPDPAARIIRSRVLGQSLIKQEYLAAAIEALDLYLNPPDLPGRNGADTNIARTLLAQSVPTRIAIGNMHLKLDQPAAAREAYERALGENTRIHNLENRLLPNLILADLRLEDPRTARDRLIDRLNQHPDDEQLIKLAGYLFSAGAGDDLLLDRLRKAYERSGQSDTMAIALAEALPDDEARRLLMEHIAAHPNARTVIAYTITQVLLAQGMDKADSNDIDRALELTIDLVDRTSDLREPLAWVPEAQRERLVITDRLATLTTRNTRQQAIAHHLRGLLLAPMPGRLPEADTAWQAAIETDPTYAPARATRAGILITRGELDEAERLLADVDPLTTPGLAARAAQIRMARQQYASALNLLDRAEESGLADTELDLIRGQILIRTDRVEEAETLLLRALEQEPESEQLYRALFTLYEKQRQTDAKTANTKWINLMRQILKAMPTSVTARIKLAQWHATRRQSERAEIILEDLLIQHPDNHLVFRAMLDLLAQQKKLEQGNERIDLRLAGAPDDTQTLKEALRFYQRTGQQDRYAATAEQILVLSPPSAQRTMELSRLYIQTDQQDKLDGLVADAIEFIEPHRPYGLAMHILIGTDRLDDAEQTARRAASLFPDHADAIHYQHYLILWTNGHEEPSMAALERTLQANPDHAPAANSLGYALVLRHEQIDRAIDLIERAVQQDPNNGSYLDSLGWAYYKAGRFGLATAWLGRAVAQPDGEYPLLHEHLGDALYRANRADQARRAWQTALDNFRAGSWSGDPELDNIEQRLTDKIEAVDRGETPEVAPIAEQHSDPALPAPTP
ncbi:tetratricopeptide repeat protein [Mucisphaera calidilacus]|uniref:Tetratricopeptide repeat protein n=1 Tax=Mucisphaera calidilacus TaxID=2527982 RepID=A0A518BW64_9BACT|nr:tetratricopeptide repeat protein [Mucisphaera calidilacus]QDU71216.1 tetratricopeptide repeat protein [Mucisphaera calidilacus]